MIEPTPKDVLRQFVVESNLIEGITAPYEDPLFSSHLAAARLLDGGQAVFHPNAIHDMLCLGVANMQSFKGEYRKVDVHIARIVDGKVVGRSPAPRWEAIPDLMEELGAMVNEFIVSRTYDQRMPEMLHIWLECIHPYEDGNGRTGRLFWNMLRRIKGLPWHIELAATKHAYYARIQSVANGLFKEKNPDVYR